MPEPLLPMDSARAGLLRQVYGDSTAGALVPRLEAFLNQWRPRLAQSGRSGPLRPLDERDAVLITYADQVQATGERPLQTLDAFAERHLRGVVSGIHLIPFYPWSSDDGFSVKDYLAVDPAYGTWDDVQHLGRHFDLMMDAVFNHMSAQGEWFRRFCAGDPAFDEFFVTVDGQPDLSAVIRPRALPLLTEFETARGSRRVWTTFSADQVDLNFRNPEVLFAVLEALLLYVERGARYVRLDAIAFLWKEVGTTCLHLPQTHQLIQLMRSVLAAVAPDVRLITETNVPHVDNVSYFGDGTNEAQLIYNFALPPLVLHSLTTGNASALTQWARSLVLPGDQVTFFNFLASHDGIGINPARGILSDAQIDALVARTQAHGGYISYKHLPDGSQAPYEMNINYLDALSDPAAREPADVVIRRMLCAHAIQLSLAGVPGIYVHSLLGSRGDRTSAERSGIPRRINREKLEARRLENELADPGHLRHGIFQGLRTLLRERARHPAFAPSGGQVIHALADSVFVVERISRVDGRRMWCGHNVSAHSVSIPHPDGGPTLTLAPYDVRWLEV